MGRPIISIAPGERGGFTDEDILDMSVAYLTSAGRTQSQIKEILGFNSQAEVSRALGRALGEKNFVTQWVMNWPQDAPRDRIEGASFPELPHLRNLLDDLGRQQSGVTLNSLHVLYCGDATTSYESRLEAFGRGAADRLVPLLRQESTGTCAVAWGRTIRAVVDKIPEDAGRREHLVFMPISGEPFNHRDTGVSPTAAAQRLANSFGASQATLSLQGVPARIPKRFDEDASTVRDFLNSIHDYKCLLGEPEFLLSKVDMILTGVGDAASSENDPWCRETIKAEGLDATTLNSLAVGNIGGVWMSRSASEDGQVNRINKRWLGIQKEHFEDCASRAATHGSDSPPGVVLVAAGPTKAAIVRATIGMVNHLIIDRTLAEQLYGLMK